MTDLTSMAASEPSDAVRDAFVGSAHNRTGIATGAVYEALLEQHTQQMKAIGSWIADLKPSYQALQALAEGPAGSSHGRNGGLFYRDRYLTPTNPFDQMRLAYAAVEQDDIVSGVAEVTEALAFSTVSMFVGDEDQQDALNQWAADIDLDTLLRQVWRELFTVSQCYVATQWGTKAYTPRRTGDAGRDARTKIELYCPTEASLLDPLKVVPVNTKIFGDEQLAWIATRAESKRFTDILGEKHEDQPGVVDRLVIGPYTPGEAERKELQSIGVDTMNLWLLNPTKVFRHCLTKAKYQRFSPIRMRSVFELLDLKQQLRQMERAHLIGGPLRVDQRIATPDGWKPIGEAKVGDKVFSVDGKPTEIIGVYPQGELSGMHRVTFTDGAEVVCDLKHPWTVRTPKGEWRTIPLSLIMEEGLDQPNGSGYGKPQKRWRHEIPMAAPLELPEKDLPVDPYLLGYLLGDGHLGGSPQVSVMEGDERPWADCIPDGCEVVHYGGVQWGIKTIPRGRQKRGEGDRENPLTKALREVGVWGHDTRDKFIPDDYLWASVGQRWSLLQGLLDSDGSARPSCGASFGSTSEKLVAGVVQLVQSLGGIAKKTRSANQPELWHLNILLPQDEAPFRLQRKVAKYKKQTRGLRRCFAKVEPVEDAEAICIKTAREDGLFLTEDMLVTHNTNFIVLITQGSDELPADPAEIAALKAQSRVVHRLPVLIGDHRLKVEIVTPKLDNTLKPERFNALDSRITARLYQMFMLGNYCSTPDTEIFTAEGWKTYGQLVEGEDVYTLDTESGVAGWQALQAINVFDHDGPMLSMEGRFHSSMTTPNHRWWVNRRYGAGMKRSAWTWATSEQLDWHHRIPMSAPYGEAPDFPKYDDALVELVAWYWTEGHAKADSLGVVLGQSENVNPGNVTRIRLALAKMFGPPAYSRDGGCWHERDRDGMIEFEVNSAPGSVLRELAPGPSKIPTMDFLRSLTAAQLELFLETAISGDGCRDGSERFTQFDEEGLRCFSAACVLAGKAVGRHSNNRNGVGKVTVLRSVFTSPMATEYFNQGTTKARSEWTYYTGIVWCPTTPNGTWLARRNGTVFWTGNSAGAQGDDSAKLVKVVARGMESRRHMIRRTLEKHIFRPMADASEKLKSNQTPTLLYHPKAIALDFDSAWASFLLQLRQDREISRETVLSQFDLSQDYEAAMRKREEEKYDDVFKSRVAFGAPDSNEANPQDPPQPGDPAKRDNGGGNRNGGGAAPGSGQGQSPRNPQRRSDRGRKQPPIAAAGLTITLTDADGEVVATAPLEALLQQGDNHAPSGEAT